MQIEEGVIHQGPSSICIILHIPLSLIHLFLINITREPQECLLRTLRAGAISLLLAFLDCHFNITPKI